MVFAAGLVLGFEIFAKRTIEFDIEAAFTGARDILNFLATQSPQAGHYYEILTLLANAISKQRQTIGTTGRSKYVSKLFNLQQTREMPDEDSLVYQYGSGSASAGVTPAVGEDAANWLIEARTPAAAEQEVFLGWDSLDISQWDNFPYVS